MLAAEVDAVAVEHGIVNTPGFRIVREGTHTVLRHRSAKTCARIAPIHATQAETAHTLHIVATLVAQDAAVLPAALPAPASLPSGRHVTFWPLASPMTNTSVTDQEIADAILSVHKTQPDPSMRQWKYSETLRRRQLKRAEQVGVPPILVKKLEDLLERTLFAVQIKDSKPYITLHADAYPENTVRHEGVVKLIGCDQAGFGPLEHDLATVAHNCRRYPTSTSEHGFLKCYDGEYDEELLQRLVWLREVSSIIWLTSMHGTKLRSLGEVQHRLDTLNTSHRWHIT